MKQASSESGGLKGIGEFIGRNGRVVPGIVVVVILVLLIAARAGYNYHLRAIDEIDSLAGRYTAMLSTLDRASELDARMEAGQERLDALEATLLAGAKPAIGAAMLQESFKGLLSKRGITVISEKPLQATERGGYTVVPVEFRFKAQVRQLTDILLDIESSTLLMGVKTLRIKIPHAGSPVVDVSMVVQSVLKGPEAL